MGFYATDTLDAAPPPRTDPVRARQHAVCGQKPLRGPIHNAISGYRFYNPELWRWINRDPIGERGGVNLYAFVGNGPISSVDYLGLDWVNLNHHAVSIHNSFSIYKKFGGTIEASLEIVIADCCNSRTGEIIKLGYVEVTGSLGGDIGIGIGKKKRILGKRVGFLFKGPNIPIYTKGRVERDCDGNVSGRIGHNWAGKLGGSISGGLKEGFGGAISGYHSAYIEYGVGIDSSSVHFYVNAEGKQKEVKIELNFRSFQYAKTLKEETEVTKWVEEKWPIYSF